MAYIGEIKQALAATGGFIDVFPAPIQANQAPTSADIGLQGQAWVYKDDNAVYFYTGNQWINASGASGSFDSLTVGPDAFSYTGVGSAFTMTSDTASSIKSSANGTSALIVEATAGGLDLLASGAAAGEDINITATGSSINITATESDAGAIVINASGGAGGITLNGGTSGLALGNDVDITSVSMGNGANTVAQTVSIANGASAANSTVDILSGVGTAGAGVLNLANNTRVTTVDIGDIAPAAARTFNIAGGDSAQDDTVNVLTGAPSANTQKFNLLSGVATGGAQEVNILSGASTSTSQTLNIMSGAGSATKTINMATGAAAATLNIGTGAAAMATNLGSQTASSLVTINTADDAGFAITDGTQTARIIVGTGSPNTSVSAPQGSLFLNVAGSADTILYVNTDGTTAWTALTST